MPSSPRRSTDSDQWQINKYLWICLLFVGVYLPLASARDWIRIPLPAAYAILGVAVANGAARTYSAWRLGGSNDQRGWIFTIIDVALIAAAVNLSGGLSSELGFLFFVLLISESLYSPPAETLVLLALMFVAYVGATWYQHLNQDYVVRMGTRLFFILTLGFFSGRISLNRERRNQELMRLREQVAASEERTRIAREVHDGLGHALVSSILRLELCARLIGKDPGEAEKILREEVPALRAAWNEGRDLAFHLRPWERDPDGLAATLRRHIGRFAQRTGLPVDLKIAEPCLELPADSEMALIRIIQEALTNVAKHAQATNVCVEVICEGEALRCRIHDDGEGFDVRACEGGFGLQAMRERAEEAAGRLTVSSHPGAGTDVALVIPSGRQVG